MSIGGARSPNRPQAGNGCQLVGRSPHSPSRTPASPRLPRSVWTSAVRFCSFGIGTKVTYNCCDSSPAHGPLEGSPSSGVYTGGGGARRPIVARGEADPLYPFRMVGDGPGGSPFPLRYLVEPCFTPIEMSFGMSELRTRVCPPSHLVLNRRHHSILEVNIRAAVVYPLCRHAVRCRCRVYLGWLLLGRLAGRVAPRFSDHYLLHADPDPPGHDSVDYG